VAKYFGRQPFTQGTRVPKQLSPITIITITIKTCIAHAVKKFLER